MKSPRLRWIEANGITTEMRVSSQGMAWTATRGDYSAKGITEDDALFAIAKITNLRMWNEL
jgi:hypothetical protein